MKSEQASRIRPRALKEATPEAARHGVNSDHYRGIVSVATLECKRPQESKLTSIAGVVTLECMG
jgi:hypothetical protein